MQSNKYNIGFFDSGKGGLQILKAVRKILPQYSYCFLSDTKNLPYGDKTQTQLRRIVINNLEILFQHKCQLVIIACNTASAKALRYVQQQWLPKYHPDKKVLGVIVPTIENITQHDFPCLLLATPSTVRSNVYQIELQKKLGDVNLIQQAMPDLAAIIEFKNKKLANQQALSIIQKNIDKKIKSIILGCTHYSILNKYISSRFPNLKVIDQVNIIPLSLKKYLNKHPEIKSLLSKNGSLQKIKALP